jgi:pyruvate/2-oxoglutarate dehydrogenase complex dihydrolipoamide acyltransferase (E2) component
VARLSAKREAEDAAAKKAAEARAAAKRDADARAARARAEKAAKEAEPARAWVQLGVGRNTAAFSFDWKKLAKQAGGALDGKGPWAARYGATNRMLAGPFPTEAAARAAVKRLQDKDIQALPYSSAEGEKVTKIG